MSYVENYKRRVKTLAKATYDLIMKSNDPKLIENISTFVKSCYPDGNIEDNLLDYIEIAVDDELREYCEIDHMVTAEHMKDHIYDIAGEYMSDVYDYDNNSDDDNVPFCMVFYRV